MADYEPSLEWLKHRVKVLESEVQARSAAAEEHRQEMLEKNRQIEELRRQLDVLREGP